MTRPETSLLHWLRDAHAMEEQAETVLDREVGRLEEYPELAAGIERHLAETREQANRLRQRIDRLNGGTSAIKDVAAKLTGFGQVVSGMFVGDEAVKGALALYTFEHMEIASYRILVAAAEEVGDSETRRVCEENLQEEVAMAAWLEEQLEPVARQYLAKELAAESRD